MANLATLLIGLGIDTREYDEGLEKSAEKTSTIGSKIASGLGTAVKVGLAASAGIAAAGIGAMVAGVASNAEFERYETQFGVLLGSTDAAKQRLQELAAFGASTPFDLPGVVRADKILQGFGLHSEESAKKFGFSGEQIRTIAGDVASGTGSSFEEMSLLLGKFSSGATGEAIARMAELGIASKTDLAAMGLEFSKSGELLSPLPQSMGVVLQLMQDKFGGMMQAQSSTFEGMVSNLMDWKDQTLRAISAPIFEVLKDKLGVLLTFLNDPATVAGLQAFAATLATGVGAAMDWLANTAIPALVGAWNTIAPVVMPLIGLIGDNFMGVLAGIGAAVAAVVVPAMASAVVAFLAVAAPVAAAIAIGIALYAAWNSNFMGIQGVVTSVMGAVQTVISTVLAFVGAFWAKNGADIVLTATTSFAQIKAIIGTTLEVIRTIIVGVASFIASFWSAHHEAILAVATTAWLMIKTGIQTTLTALQGIITAVLQVISGDWSGAWETIKTTATTIGETIKTNLGATFTQVRDTVVRLAGELKTNALAKIEELKAGIVGMAAGFVSSALSIGNAIIDGIKNGISNGVGALTSAVENAAQSALDAAKRLLGISSPSRVFAAQVGAPIVDGIALGVDNAFPAFADNFAARLGNLATVGSALVSGAELAQSRAAGKAGASGITPASTPSGIQGSALGGTINGTPGNQFNITAIYREREGMTLSDEIRQNAMLFGK